MQLKPQFPKIPVLEISWNRFSKSVEIEFQSTTGFWEQFWKSGILAILKLLKFATQVSQFQTEKQCKQSSKNAWKVRPAKSTKTRRMNYTVKKSRNCPKNKRSVFSSFLRVFCRPKPPENDYYQKPANSRQLRGQGLMLVFERVLDGPKLPLQTRYNYPNVWKS